MRPRIDAAPTPHRKRHTTSQRIVKDALSNSAYVPCCDCGAMVEVVYGLAYAQSHHIRCCNCKQAARDKKRTAATCPMCGKPMMECDGHFDKSDTDLAVDYAKTFPAAARYEWQALMFDGRQMAALSPEAARYQRRKVERE